MLSFLADIDGNIVGLGSLSGGLVIALGYMLRHSRDSDTRVDKAYEQTVTNMREQRDQALKDRDEAVRREFAAAAERDHALDELRVAQSQLQVAINNLERRGKTT